MPGGVGQEVHAGRVDVSFGGDGEDAADGAEDEVEGEEFVVEEVARAEDEDGESCRERKEGGDQGARVRLTRHRGYESGGYRMGRWASRWR